MIVSGVPPQVLPEAVDQTSLVDEIFCAVHHDEEDITVAKLAGKQSHAGGRNRERRRAT